LGAGKRKNAGARHAPLVTISAGEFDTRFCGKYFQRDYGITGPAG
jgi:hypothetical protein